MNWDVDQSILVSVSNNSLRDKGRSGVVRFSVSNAQSDPLYRGLVKDASVIISDDDPAPLSGVLFGTGPNVPTFLYEPNGDPSRAFNPFAGDFTPNTGISVAYGDVNFDSVDDFVVGLGPGSLSIVKVFPSGKPKRSKYLLGICIHICRRSECGNRRYQC